MNQTRILSQDLIGQGVAMQGVFSLMHKAAEKPNINVVLQGEPGTGKGLIAAKIHELSPSADSPFVTCYCREATIESLSRELALAGSEHCS